MRGLGLAVAVFVLLALVGALVPACGGEEAAPATTPTDAELHQLLAELPAQAALALAFPDVTFQPLLPSEAYLTFLIPAHPEARLEVLGRLAGHLSGPDRPEVAVLLYLRENAGDQESEPALGLEEGLYMVLLGIDHDQPALGGISMFDASAGEFLELPTAQEEGRHPFRQGVDGTTATGAIDPAVASDVDNDGVDELILLDSSASQGIRSAEYLTYDWTGPGLRWRRMTTAGPSTAVLDYLAVVQAADGTAEDWDGTPRLLAWEWLSVSPPSPVSADLLAQLAAGDGPDAEATARRKLEATRDLLETAYGLLSAHWQQRQPWTDFVYGFRNATGVRIEQMLPPRQEAERTVVEIVIIATSREGSVFVDRRFRVVYTVVKEATGWRLDSLDAHEESLTG